jgi:magnesium and cobalt transporter
MLHLIISTAHSRFPVYQGERENIIGILMAKDLLKLQRAPELNIRALLRPAVFVPESKGLNDLLREFRGNRNHLAVVIDEFGRVAGLVTIEDVLEQIVGEIEDEFDIPEEEGDIFALADRTYRVSGDTPVERVSEAFGVQVVGSDADEAFDTIGGLIAHEMGHVPRRGEQLALCGLQFVVLHTKGGRCVGSRWRHCRPIRQRLPDDFPTVRASAAQALAGAVVGGCGWGLQAASLAWPGNGQPLWWLQMASLAVLAWL